MSFNLCCLKILEVHYQYYGLVNPQFCNAAPNISVAEDMDGTRMKRKRKPSEKGLELQAELVRKPLKTIKPSGKLSKAKHKSVFEEDMSIAMFVDDGTDDQI